IAAAIPALIRMCLVIVPPSSGEVPADQAANHVPHLIGPRARCTDRRERLVAGSWQLDGRLFDRDNLHTALAPYDADTHVVFVTFEMQVDREWSDLQPPQLHLV